MENLTPHIYRQRMVIEGLYSIRITSAVLRRFMRELSRQLRMTIVYGPIVKRLAE
jgi:hypothetical protein